MERGSVHYWWCDAFKKPRAGRIPSLLTSPNLILVVCGRSSARWRNRPVKEVKISPVKATLHRQAAREGLTSPLVTEQQGILMPLRLIHANRLSSDWLHYIIHKAIRT